MIYFASSLPTENRCKTNKCMLNWLNPNISCHVLFFLKIRFWKKEMQLIKLHYVHWHACSVYNQPTIAYLLLSCLELGKGNWVEMLTLDCFGRELAFYDWWCHLWEACFSYLENCLPCSCLMWKWSGFPLYWADCWEVITYTKYVRRKNVYFAQPVCWKLKAI